jgi:predicted enzyme related to lactoylglutathione lyase
MEAATAFYTAVLGVSPSHVSPFWTAFDAGGVTIGLHGPDGDEAPAPSGGWTLCIACDDLPGLVARVRAAGGLVEDGYHQTPRGAVATFRDLDGNRLQAIEPGSDAAELQHGAC